MQFINSNRKTVGITKGATSVAPIFYVHRLFSDL